MVLHEESSPDDQVVSPSDQVDDEDNMVWVVEWGWGIQIIAKIPLGRGHGIVAEILGRMSIVDRFKRQIHHEYDAVQEQDTRWKAKRRSS